MAENLRAMLGDMAEREPVEVDPARSADYVHLYSSAIRPRRRARAAGVALAGGAATVAVVLGVHAVTSAWTPGPSDPVAPATTEPEPSPLDSIREQDDESAAGASLFGPEDWAIPVDPDASEVGTLPLDPVLRAAAFESSSDSAFSTTEQCVALEGWDGLEAEPSLGGEAFTAGGFATADGVIEVRVRDFSTSAAATDYLAQAEEDASGCAAALGDDPVQVTAETVALTTMRGDGLRVRFATGEPAPRTVWIHVDGTAAIAVTVEEGVDDRGAEIVQDWLRSR